MSVDGVRLDGRGRDDLAAEARARVRAACPELSANGGPDPTSTLIELFSWMSQLAVERLARLPDKLHVALLDTLGIEPRGPAAARTDVRMRLSAPAERPVPIPAGTEVGTLRTATTDAIVFEVEEDFTIAPLRPASYMIERDGAFKDVGVADGIAHPRGGDQRPFARTPAVGDALYLGFEEGLGRLLMRVVVEASMARGAGVNPEDPPLRWEVSQSGGAWAEVEVLEDTTGGFNYGSGTIEVQCPSRSGVESIAGRRLHWLRCRIAETTRIGRAPTRYRHAPEIYEITAAPCGAHVPVEHSTVEVADTLGTSDGTPGQRFALRRAPVLPLAPDEALEIEIDGAWERWERVDSFADSTRRDPHFTLDPVAGRIGLGPAVSDASGRTTQRGQVPPKGCALRMSRYRHGGGASGNVAAETITTLRSTIPGVASVTNPEPARGGVACESPDSVRAGAAPQIRTRYRAVTAQDYELVAAEASPRVGRALAVDAGEPGVTLRILPRADPADRRLAIEELTPDPQLLGTIERYLDARKPVGCPVRLEPVRFRGVCVVANLATVPRADAERVEHEVRTSLYRYLNPLLGGAVDGDGSGWPFGRPLHQGELYALLQAVAGVESVGILRLYEVDLVTGERADKPSGRQILLEPDEVIASGEHIVRAVRPVA